MTAIDVPAERSPFLTRAHLAMPAQAREFADAELAPRVEAMEHKGTHTDTDLAKLMGALGWFGLLVAPAYGGSGAGHVARTVLLSELAEVSGAAAAILQASLIPTTALEVLGSAEQKRRWLPPIAQGLLFPTIAVTEPATGSHLLGMATTARRKGRHWLIRGQKVFVGNSGISDLHIVIARTGKPGYQRSLSAFLVEADRPGITLTEPPRVGLHGFTTGTLTLDGVRVPAENLLGNRGDGLAAAHVGSVVVGRPNFAAIALGLHHRLLDETARFLAHRPRYDATLAHLPVVRHHLGEMKLRLLAAEALTYHAAHLLDQGAACDEWLIASKASGKQAVIASLQQAEDLHGGQAVRAGTTLDRLNRDIRHLPAPAGPDDIQLLRLGESVRGADRTQWSEFYIRRTKPSVPLSKATAPATSAGNPHAHQPLTTSNPSGGDIDR
jgi:alkylation response protein AidB-like acyl-CoA dehydrogenase